MLPGLILFAGTGLACAEPAESDRRGGEEKPAVRTFSDVTDEVGGLSGYKNVHPYTAPHAAWGDFDNDGYLDLYCWSTGSLFRNQDGKHFEEVAMPEGHPKQSRGACWGDFDGDGWLDLYLSGFEVWPLQEFSDVIFRSLEGKSFELLVVIADRCPRGTDELPGLSQSRPPELDGHSLTRSRV
jgi:hypothetical protein